MLDGAPIPNVFHFAGLSTVINGDAIAEIALLPGNYGVRYGRTLGGVVDLRLDTQLPERSRGYVSVESVQVNGLRRAAPLAAPRSPFRGRRARTSTPC